MKRRFEKGDQVDIVEVNEDGEELWPWRGVVRKWCEDTGAYEIVNGVKGKVLSILRTYVHPSYGLVSGHDVIVLNDERSEERCGRLVEVNEECCRVDFGGTSTETLEPESIFLAPYESGQYVRIKHSSTSGRICAVWMRGYVYNVRTQTGRTISNVPRHLIDLVRPLKVRERVEARWGIVFGGKEWLPGRITRTSNRKIAGQSIIRYDIQYDNGEKETDVDRTLIRPI